MSKSKILKARTMELRGTHYEIGRRLGQMTAAIPPLKELHTGGMANFGKTQVQEAAALLDRWCPGVTEELQGFADALEVPLVQVFFYGMTYLLPRCSQIALPPAQTACGRPMVARNYEFSHEAEDFCLVKTAPAGKYTHMGTSVLHFGRDDGFNDQGLAVTMSSCGFPVGPMPYMRSPKIKGLQFWAVIRGVLENCRDTADAVDYVKEMPVAFNINLMLTDKSGRIALVETLDGQQAVHHLDKEHPYLHATNHAVIPELVKLEPQALRHSLIRYDWIKAYMAGKSALTEEDLKAMLLSKFPEGLCCNYFEDYFGTTKSMLIDPACGTIELCWGGNEKNGWKKYSIKEPLAQTIADIEIHMEKFVSGMAEFLPL